jgi:PAS domain S-box-containing protein
VTEQRETQRHVAQFAVVRYGLAILCVAAAATLALWLRPVVLAAAQLFLVAILVTGWVSGLGPALLATLLATVALDYYFTPPFGSLRLGVAELPRLAIFVMVAAFIATMSAARRKAERSLKTVRDGLETRVRERTDELQQTNERLTGAVAAAVAAQQRFQDLVNTVEGIVWEADATTLQFFFVSNRAERILGYPVARWLSEPTFWKDHLHSNDRAWVIPSCENRDHDVEYRMIAADGTVVWLRDLASVVIDEDGRRRLRGVMVDITVRRRGDAALREQAGLLDLTHDTIFVRDMNDVITYWNRAAEQFYGWTAAKAIGTVSHDLMQTVFPAPFEHIRAELLRAGRWDGELRHTRADGSRAVVASRWSLQHDDHGQPCAILEINNDITTRKQAEARLLESEQRYRDIFESTGVSIWEEDFSHAKAAIDALGFPGGRGVREYFAGHPEFVRQAARMIRVIDVNHATLKLFAAGTKNELLGSLNKIIVPETREAIVSVLVGVAEGQTSVEAETVVQTLTGDRLTVLFTLAFPPPPSRMDRVLMTVMNITERKRAEYLAGHVFETAPDAIYIVGKDYRYQRVNPAFERRWRLPAQTIVGMTVDELAGTQTFEETYKPHFDRCFAGEDVRFVGWFPTPAGKQYLAATYSPLRPDSSRVEAALAITRDITDYARAAEALQQTQAELAHVTRVTTLGELTASIAHEINQPLSAIVADASASFNWLAMTSPDLDKVREALGAIVKDGHRAADVIQRIRQLATKRDPQRARLHINDVIRDVVPLIGTELRRHDVSLQLDLAPELPPVVADRVQLQQVLINFVMNGIEAMTPIDTWPRALVIRSRHQDGQSLTVAVQDTGVGIDPDKADQIFNAFFTTKPGGMGMGLAISRSIIEGHGGRIWATSNADHGATFQFALPAGH